MRVEYCDLEISEPGKDVQISPIPVSGLKELAPAHQQADGFRYPPYLGQSLFYLC
jgi:hypothetical protein